MIQMRVSERQAKAILAHIEHARCQQGVRNRWRTYTDTNGKEQATPQSVCWLFCWATTGMGSEKAAQQAQDAFDRIFDHSYDWLRQRLPLQAAYQLRYNSADIKQQFTAYLSRKVP